jgi:hypothetical protein
MGKTYLLIRCATSHWGISQDTAAIAHHKIPEKPSLAEEGLSVYPTYARLSALMMDSMSAATM